MLSPTPRRLGDLPLGQLLKLLHDAERYIGPDSQTFQSVARVVTARLTQQASPKRGIRQRPGGGAKHGRY